MSSRIAKTVWSSLASITLAFALAVAPSQAQEPSQSFSRASALRFEQACDSLEEMLDLIAKHALRPSTEQEMMLQATRAVLAASKKPLPADFVSELSQAANREERKKLLTRTLTELPWTGQLQFTLLNGALLPLRGHASLLPLEEVKTERQIRDNLYVGIGIQLAQRDRFPQIRMAFPKGPAQKAGAKDGDLIVAVDGVSTKGKPLGEVVTMLRGPRGEAVRVALQFEEDEPREVTMVRDVVPIDSLEGVKRDEQLEWEFQMGTQPEIAWIRIVEFKGSTVAELRKAARRIREHAFKGVILDLSKVSGSGKFRHGAVFVQLITGDQELGGLESRAGMTKVQSSEEEVLGDLPMVVLIGPQTLGVGEWVAAALQDSGRATLIGAPTTGSGQEHSEFDLASGYELRLVTGYMARANGERLATPQAIYRNGVFLNAQSEYWRQNAEKIAAFGAVQPDIPSQADAKSMRDAAIQVLRRHREKSVLQNKP